MALRGYTRLVPWTAAEPCSSSSSSSRDSSRSGKAAPDGGRVGASPEEGGGGGAAPARPGTPVTLHIYHVSTLTMIRRMNTALHAAGTGAYHAGVDVYGKEWSFGASSDGGTGVFWSKPRECEVHTYSHSVFMGDVQLQQSEVLAILCQLAKEWQGDEYDLLHCNCCHFAAALCRELGVGPVPSSLTSLAGRGAALDDQLQVVSSGASAVVARANEHLGWHRRGGKALRRAGTSPLPPPQQEPAGPAAAAALGRAPRGRRGHHAAEEHRPRAGAARAGGG